MSRLSIIHAIVGVILVYQLLADIRVIIVVCAPVRFMECDCVNPK